MDVPEGVNVKHGDMVIILTDKGEEVAEAELAPPQVASAMKQKKIPPVPFVRIMTDEDKALYEEIKLMEEQGYKDCLKLIQQHNLQMNFQ